jgi:isopenicillin-N epimerase
MKSEGKGKKLNSLADKFLLDPEVIFLNHGSFGATPRSVFDRYQGFQRELEKQPVAFLGRDFQSQMSEARQTLANYLNTPEDHIVYVNNATTAINIVARNLALAPGDEVLATDHEYGAMDRTWKFLSQKRGFSYIRQPIPVPISDSSHILENLWKGVTSKTRVLFVSHITSPTSVIFPVKEICEEARSQGILTLIDGAHAPGQISLDLSKIQADFYAGNLHKWLCAPKGAGFLYARPEHHHLLDPLIVSWGWQSEKPGSSLLIDHHEWQGTRDPAAWLAVPEAIQFQHENQWDSVRHLCHEMAVDVQNRLVDLAGMPALTDSALFAQMVSHPLPISDPDALQRHLMEKNAIEVPIFEWNEKSILRVSIQGYNSPAQIDLLINALKHYWSH